MMKKFKNNVLTLALTGAFIIGASVTVTGQVTPPTKVNTATTAQLEVNTEELTKFAAAFQEVQRENQVIQGQMVAVIKKEGLEPQRFGEIQQATLNPDVKVNATEEELKMHKAATAELEKMQPALEAKMEAIVTKEGITFDRFKAVATALQSDSTLQQRLQGILMKMQTEG